MATQYPLRLAAVLALCLGLPCAPAGAAPQPFEAATMIIEFNSTDRDIGIQFFLDVEGWEAIGIRDPNNREIFRSTAKSELLGLGGGTELFLESFEPEFPDITFRDFFERFPKGTYTFIGHTPDGTPLRSTALFTHRIPEGPQIVMPNITEDECAENVPLPVDIAWNPVTTTIFDDPVTIRNYQVIVERNGREVFNVLMPPGVTTVTVPQGILRPGQEVSFEVLAIETGGNQTITESCLVTAD
jgi:hypothetical protein